MEMEPVPGYVYANWERGYGDFHLVPDLSTLRIADWLSTTAIVLCDLHDPRTHDPVEVAPRSILRRQIDRLADAGFSAMAASELEYFMFEDSFREASERGYAGLTPVGWYSEDYHLLQGTREEFFNHAARRALTRSGIPVETSKGETGRGQHELNIRYADILAMSDRHSLMKLCMKEIADDLGISVTFMAKPHDDDAGSSCHIHLSLWDGDRPVFPGEHEIGPIRGSDEFRWFLGGWMAHLPEVMPFYVPTVNSYKRFVDGVVGTNADRVELRQPDGRLPCCRQRPEPEDRESCARVRREPVPGLCGDPGCGPRWNHQPDRAPRHLHRGRLRRRAPTEGA